jgi:hypothetical protein
MPVTKVWVNLLPTQHYSVEEEDYRGTTLELSAIPDLKTRHTVAFRVEPEEGTTVTVTPRAVAGTDSHPTTIVFSGRGLDRVRVSALNSRGRPVVHQDFETWRKLYVKIYRHEDVPEDRVHAIARKIRALNSSLAAAGLELEPDFVATIGETGLLPLTPGDTVVRRAQNGRHGLVTLPLIVCDEICQSWSVPFDFGDDGWLIDPGASPTTVYDEDGITRKISFEEDGGGSGVHRFKLDLESTNEQHLFVGEPVDSFELEVLDSRLGTHRWPSTGPTTLVPLAPRGSATESRRSYVLDISEATSLGRAIEDLTAWHRLKATVRISGYSRGAYGMTDPVLKLIGIPCHAWRGAGESLADITESQALAAIVHEIGHYLGLASTDSDYHYTLHGGAGVHCSQGSTVTSGHGSTRGSIRGASGSCVMFHHTTDYDLSFCGQCVDDLRDASHDSAAIRRRFRAIDERALHRAACAVCAGRS